MTAVETLVVLGAVGQTAGSSKVYSTADRDGGVDVYFGERLVVSNAQFFPGVFERHRVRAGVAWTQPRERAEQAARHAHVGRLDADVVVVVRQIAVPPLALPIRQRCHLEQIGCSNRRTPSSSDNRSPRSSLSAIFPNIDVIVSQPAFAPRCDRFGEAGLVPNP